MADSDEYAISLEKRFGYLTVIDVPSLVTASTDRWSNQTLTQVDGSVVRDLRAYLLWARQEMAKWDQPELTPRASR